VSQKPQNFQKSPLNLQIGKPQRFVSHMLRLLLCAACAAASSDLNLFPNDDGLSLLQLKTVKHTDPAPIDFAEIKYFGQTEEQRGPDQGHFFTGDWAGTRNDFTGEVGIDFRASQDFTITQLGRHINAGSLAEAKLVTLWSTTSRSAIAQVVVGPDSTVEGTYAFAALQTPVTVKSGEEYRLSQQCTRGMQDRWFDGRAPDAGDAMADFAAFIGGVYNVGFGYPRNNDGAGRRAGMVNFKMGTDDGEGSAYFTGDWAGTRNDFTGEVGVDFRASKDFTITQLGRHVNANSLAEAKLVTLWSTTSRRALAQVVVGPDSSVEGDYAFSVLQEPVNVQSGQEYRISQQCTRGMQDRWFDGKAPDAGNAMSDFATFIGGVYNVGFGYPQNNDGAGRRAGMVNFKIEVDEQSPYFTGDWAGARNDFTGEVGVNFRAVADFTITQLGRHVNADSLTEAKLVTLWSATSRSALAQVVVGPDSNVEGNYAFTALQAPVTVSSGEEYRISQQCTRGMQDRWFDGRAPDAGDAMSDFATFIGGVYNVGFGYPKNSDGAGRRAGLVNFKVATAGKAAPAPVPAPPPPPPPAPPPPPPPPPPPQVRPRRRENRRKIEMKRPAVAGAAPVPQVRQRRENRRKVVMKPPAPAPPPPPPPPPPPAPAPPPPPPPQVQQRRENRRKIEVKGPAPKCTTKRNGPFTIMSCPGKKTEISMTMKGFDIAVMTPKKLKIIEAYKAKVRQDYSRFLNLPADSIVVEIKSGSVIVIGAVAPEEVPDNFQPGDGQNLLSELKAMPGVEDLVEEGKQLDDCEVDPEPAFPAVINDEAAAVGDPHLSVATGVNADLCCDGGHCVACE